MAIYLVHSIVNIGCLPVKRITGHKWYNKNYIDWMLMIVGFKFNSALFVYTLEVNKFTSGWIQFTPNKRRASQNSNQLLSSGVGGDHCCYCCWCYSCFWRHVHQGLSHWVCIFRFKTTEFIYTTWNNKLGIILSFIWSSQFGSLACPS